MLCRICGAIVEAVYQADGVCESCWSVHCEANHLPGCVTYASQGEHNRKVKHEPLTEIEKSVYAR